MRNGWLVSTVNTVQYPNFLTVRSTHAPRGTMSNDKFDYCQCIWSNEWAMQRLLTILRHSQDYCTDNECFSMPELPDPRGNASSSDFFTTFLFIAFIVLMYAIRPKSLRSQRNDRVKRREDEHDGNNEPPAPPPRAN